MISLETLFQNYVEAKEVKPSNNELLDFVQRYYINGKISISQYRDLFRELHLLGAEKPIFFIENLRDTAVSATS